MAAKLIGAHMPSDGGIAGSILNGASIGCTAVQVFTSSPRMWKSAFPDETKTAAFKAAVNQTAMKALISHDSYLVNLADATPERRQKSIHALTDELLRCAAYGIPLVVSHMGAHVGQGVEVGLQKVIEGAKEVLSSTPDEVTLLMETTAGQGTCLNSRFEQIAAILDGCGNPGRLGVCLDTCHVYAAGYDIRTREGYESMWEEFDRLIGLDKLKAIHCNDSKKKVGSRVDRHENLGLGEIGPIPFQCLVNDPRFEYVPIVVETPIEDDGHRKNVAQLWAWTAPGGTTAVTGKV